MDNKILAKLLSQAREKYPILQEGNMMQDPKYSYNPQNDSGWLEYYPSDEIGTEQYPRPANSPVGYPAIEVRKPNVTPDMLMGDIASHDLINTDPIVSDHYRQFKESLTPEQEEKQLQRFFYEQANYNEGRGYDKWREYSGDPGYFRAYPFKQWGDDPKVYDEMYTPEQKTKLDAMVKYLRLPR